MEIPGQSQQVPVTKPKRQKRTRENVADILDRRNESRRYMQINYWDSWEDVFRASKCRTKPIMVTDKSGKEVEDKTRTNVAMPELSLIIRRKTARLTANPPQINYTVAEGGNSDLADKLTAWSYQQFDRSGEAQEHRRTVQSSQTFGWGVAKLYWDTVETTKKFFQPVSDLSRTDLRGLDGDQAGDEDSDDPLNDDEKAQAIAKYGNTTKFPRKLASSKVR